MTKRQRLILGSACCLAAIPRAAYAHNPFEFQTPVTPIARETLYVHDLFLTIIAVLFSVGFGFLLFSIIRYRRGRGHQAATFSAPLTPLQWGLSALPILTLVVIDYIVMGIPAYHAVLTLADTRNDAGLVVKVTGSQWRWRYDYPDAGISFISNLTTPAEQRDSGAPTDPNYLLEVDKPLVLPVGKKVRVLLTSTDVIHAWWIPSFGIKQDAVPGFLRETWVKIDRPGIYRGQCAELCGVGHAFMPIVVEAKAQLDFDKWLADAQTLAAKAAAVTTLSKAELLQRGQQDYANYCATCHQPTGLGMPGAIPPIAGNKPFSAPPAMTDLLAQRGFYNSGKIIVGPVARHIDIVLKGIPGTPMPAFGTQLTDADVAALVTYERNSFGNQTGDVVQPSAVKAARAK
jgi:cytochrome c oxidase subunit 2